jgi:UDP-N-acetylmuramyl pentapeptide phosphotransferase/UDP-N-acetylglucosamine-1-phosphate transferase
MQFALSSALAFLLAFLLTWYFAKPSAKVLILDRPNERSLHQIPVPRTGGIALVLGLLAAIGLLAWSRPLPLEVDWLVAAFAIVAGVSLADDFGGIAVPMRLLIHLLGAFLLWLGGFYLRDAALPGTTLTLPAGVSLAVTLLFIAWMINLYNFMDGMDGFAAGMAIFGFGAFAYLGFTHAEPILGAMSLFVVAAAGGFLCFNFPAARIFMGDVGAGSLGLWAAAMILWGNRTGAAPLWTGLLIFSPFWVDATWTLGRRAVQGEKPWTAHRGHFYQRLVRLGWGHRRTVLWEYALMLACGVSGILSVEVHHRLFEICLALLWASIYLVLGLAVHRLEKICCE